MVIKYVKLDPNAPDFTQPNEGDGGFDIRANEDATIGSYDKAIVSTGIAIAIPTGYVGLVRGRSGLAFKNDIYPFHGTIDSSFRGELKVLIHYDPDVDKPDTYTIKRGDKIAQVVFVQYLSEPTELVDSLDETTRGQNGFGSTGV